jgi:predicted Rossmann fold flavoprotein
MTARHVIVVGGGAAGFFAAITAAEAGARVTLLERGPQLLSKVRISGGGRCNVTHACFDGREFATRYPRGGQALIGAFKRFQASDTVAWFEARGVTLKTESDGRMFPVTDDSATIVQCLERAAREAGVVVRTNCGVDSVRRTEAEFGLTLTGGEKISCERLLLATGGCRAAVAGTIGGGAGAHD